jgi:hypothetical protein
MAKKKPSSLKLHPEPPPDAEVFYHDEHGRPCKRTEATWFTWVGAKTWYKIERVDK